VTPTRPGAAGSTGRRWCGLLVATLDGIEDGSLEARPQPAEGASVAPKITVEDAHVDWAEPALAVDRRLRACTPAPGAWTTYDGTRVKLGPVTHTDERLPAGELRVGKAEVLVGTATTAVRLGEVKAFGARQMPAPDWARGLRLPVTVHFDAAGQVPGVE
jgi:methionyl-tRNA formyltransferase